MSETENLQPCPFCGGAAHLAQMADAMGLEVAICDHCLVTAPAHIWQRRVHPEPETTELVEAVRAMTTDIQATMRVRLALRAYDAAKEQMR